jgi:RNA polymerase sigma factor (sigma-70 family)
MHESTDAELIAQFRSGEESASAELYARHRVAAWRFAVSIAGRSDAEDLVSEAFLRVFAALRKGVGPDTAFRAYLITTLRNTHLGAIRRDGRLIWVEDYSAVEKHAPTSDDFSLRGESSLLARAFTSLPERWQVVLWHTTIEHDPHEDVARILGISPSAVAALAYRARGGLRQAYLAAHLAETGDDTCREVREQLPAFELGRLSPRVAAEIEAHLEECDDCRAAGTELRGITANVGALLAPALLGAAATHLPSGGATTAGVPGTGLRLLRRLRPPRSAVATTGLAAASVAIVAGALVAQSLEPWSEPTTTVSTPAIVSSGDEVDPPTAPTTPAPHDLEDADGDTVTDPTAPATTPRSTEPRSTEPSPTTTATDDSRSGGEPTAPPRREDRSSGVAPSGARETDNGNDTGTAAEPVPTTVPPVEPEPTEPETPSGTTSDQRLSVISTSSWAGHALVRLAIDSADVAPRLTLHITSAGYWSIPLAHGATCTSTSGAKAPTTVTCTFDSGYSGPLSLLLVDHEGGAAVSATLDADGNDDPAPADNVVEVTIPEE